MMPFLATLDAQQLYVAGCTAWRVVALAAGVVPGALALAVVPQPWG